MPSSQYAALLPAIPFLADFKHLFETSLCGNWILRIEHTRNITQHHTLWHAFGKPMFAVRDAETVCNAILACRAQYPARTIRLVAERYQPEIRQVFWVHRPGDQPRLTTVKATGRPHDDSESHPDAGVPPPPR